MVSHVRAKFRCMSKTESWDGVTTFTFRPIHPHNNEPDHEENKRFWKATPNGGLELVFASGPVPAYRVGAYYFVDLRAEDSARPWGVYSVEKIHEGQTNVCLHPTWQTEGTPRTGTLRLGLDTPDSRDWFSPGQKWSVTLEQSP